MALSLGASNPAFELLGGWGFEIGLGMEVTGVLPNMRHLNRKD